MIFTAWRTSSGLASRAREKSIRISSRSRRAVSSSSPSGGGGGGILRLPIEVGGGGTQNLRYAAQLLRVGLGLLLLPILADGGAAAQGLGNEFLRNAFGAAELFKSVVIKQKFHPIYVQIHKSQKSATQD